MWPTAVAGEQDCGWDKRGRRGLAMAGGYPGGSFWITNLQDYFSLVTWFSFSLVFPKLTSREKPFASDAGLTHSFFCHWPPDICGWSCLRRLRHLREVDPIRCSLFPKVRKQMTEKSTGEFWNLIRTHSAVLCAAFFHYGAVLAVKPFRKEEFFLSALSLLYLIWWHFCPEGAMSLIFAWTVPSRSTYLP